MPSRTLTSNAAYRKGWTASSRPDAALDAAEGRFITFWGEAQHDAFVDGWTDRAVGRPFGHLLDGHAATCPDCSDDKYSGEDYY